MAPPPCRKVGRQCRALHVTLRVTAVEGNEDHDATWLLGHTERIDFGPLYEEDGELWSDAVITVPCRFLASGDDGTSVRCTAHGYTGRVNQVRRATQPRRLGGDRFAIVDQHRVVARRMELPPPPRRSLPLAPSTNPCADASCRTSDLKRGDACCRDVHVDVRCRKTERMLEALIRNRKAPYLCKAHREEEDQLVVEIISACNYLRPEGGCDLHGRTRPDGRPAKPLLCSRWPEKRSGLHPGCAFRSRKIPLG